MRFGVAALLGAACVSACAPATSEVVGPTTSVAPAAASQLDLKHYFGSYATDDGDTIVIARAGWFYDLRSGAYRTIYSTGSPSRFTIGPAFEVALPVWAELVFGSDILTVNENSRQRRGHRIAYQQTDVVVPADGALLAATITVPKRAGPHPGIVIVHGAERGERYLYDVWVGIYASLGLAVLAYDKRGVGSSTGVYPGEAPTDTSLAVYAGDADAALRFLSRWPGIDSKRVGFHGGSQGGWTVPLAMLLHPQARFAVLASAPASTVDATDLWAGFTSGGESASSESEQQMLAAVRATHSGFDPTPALRAMTVPALWLLGTNDRTVPTAVCVEILNGMRKPNFTVHLLPTGHALLVNPTGMLADDARSPGLPMELVPAIQAWMAHANVTRE